MSDRSRRPSTKAELVALKTELKVARDGADLLERKRDLLMVEGIALLRQSRQKRRALTPRWERLWRQWQATLSTEAVATLHRLADAVPPIAPLENRGQRWMSVIRLELEQQAPSLELLGTPGQVGICPEQVRGELAALLPELVTLLTLETNVRRIAAAIKQCHRQVNALNRVVIPELAAQKRRIEQRLEEKEREALFQIKRLKARLE